MKDFVKLCVAAGCGGLTTVAGLGCGGFLFLAMMLVATTMPQPRPGDALLVLDLDLPVADAPPRLDPLEALPVGGGGPSVHPVRLWEITDALRRAADDDQVRGVLLRGNVASDGLRSGWAALTELRAALDDFRASGKPVCATATIYDEPTYYLASAADHVWVDPMGGVLLDGFASQRMYFASALEKLGVEVQVTRVGKYKSAVEPFLADERSPEDREQTALLLAAIEGRFVDDVAGSRGMTGDVLRALMAEGRLQQGDEALDRGLIDAAVGHSDMIAELEDLLGVSELETFTVESYLDPQRDLERPSGAVAVIYAEGAIVDGDGHDGVAGDTLARTLRNAAEDDDLEAVVLRVNSPGGSAIASEVILREVVALSHRKPVVVSMGTLAASGGYWIACRADHIVAEPNTITGSIGVFGMLPNASGLLDTLGLSVDVVKTAEHADALSFHRARTDEEMASVQEVVDAIYDGFLERVSVGRGMDRAVVAELAQGRVWSGEQALELGLVDALGGLDDAIAVARDRASLSSDAPVRFPQVEEPDPFDAFLREVVRQRRNRPLTRAGLALEVDGLRRELEQVLGQGPVVARMPYLLRIR